MWDKNDSLFIDEPALVEIGLDVPVKEYSNYRKYEKD